VKRLLRRLRDEESGQAAMEYAIMSAYLLVFVGAASPWVIRFAPEMLNALQIYMDGFYFTLALPLP
jgi:hypothetical protein